MFTQIRSKSVLKQVKLMLHVLKCETLNEQTINLAELKVEVPEINNVIELTDNISVELKYPSFEFNLSKTRQTNAETEFSYLLINNCIDRCN